MGLTFLVPAFLAGLLVIGIPIVVHLRGGRYVYFTRKPNETALLRLVAQFDRMQLEIDGAAW